MCNVIHLASITSKGVESSGNFPWELNYSSSEQVDCCYVEDDFKGLMFYQILFYI